MGWYCFHNRDCLDCGNVFESEYDTLKMINDNHLRCPNCGSYNSKESLKSEKSFTAPALLGESRCPEAFDFFENLPTGHSTITTYHGDSTDFKEFIKKIGINLDEV